jgi:2-methylcitrate dehydratase PrpD
MTLASELAAFTSGLRFEALPADVVEKARTCLLNGYGIALGCHDTPFAPVARRAALAMDSGHPSGATILGTGARVGVGWAALANAALFHGRAQEDTCGAAHFGANLIPLLTALFEARALPVSRLIPALVAGYEAGGLLEQAYAPQTTPAGIRSTSLYGPIAAAAAVARALEFTPEQTSAALSNAASFAGGTLQSFSDGTDEWRYQPGVAGQLGLAAAALAEAGSVSAPHAFEGPAGFVRAYARVSCEVRALVAKLGREWSIHRVTFKPYPVCAFNQTPVTAALALREKVAGHAPARVRVRMNPYETGYAGMDSKGPFNSISGTLMSIPFCIATTLVRGTPTMAAMTTYDDPAVNALVDRIDLVPDEGVARLCCIIEATLDDGRAVVEDRPMTVADFAFDRRTVAALVRRIGAEQRVPMSAYDDLERFVSALPGGDIADAVRAFGRLPAATR